MRSRWEAQVLSRECANDAKKQQPLAESRAQSPTIRALVRYFKSLTEKLDNCQCGGLFQQLSYPHPGMESLIDISDYFTICINQKERTRLFKSYFRVHKCLRKCSPNNT